MVRDGRLELPTSCSQSKRATNCANPGFLVIEFCSRCGQTCGQAVFLTISACGGSACIAGVSRDCGHGIFWLERGASCSQTRRDTNFAIPGYSISSIILRWGRKSKIFLSVVIYVVKAAFVPFSATGGKPAIARAARHSGLLSKPRMDRVYALPNQARYQLRYTRIKIRRPLPGGVSTIPVFSPACKGKICPVAFCLGGLSSLPDYSPSAAFSSSTRSVFSQATPRSSRPIWP